MANTTLTFEQKLRVLFAYGFTLGLRDGRVKEGFSGHYMVRDRADDADDINGWSLVGDNVTELVDEAYAFAGDFSMFQEVVADVVAGGVGRAA